MKTFNDLSKGVIQNQIYFVASNPSDGIEAIKTDGIFKDYYIVKNEFDSIEIYVNMKAIPNGIARYGKIYEGRSKKMAIAAISNEL